MIGQKISARAQKKNKGMRQGDRDKQESGCTRGRETTRGSQVSSLTNLPRQNVIIIIIIFLKPEREKMNSHLAVLHLVCRWKPSVWLVRVLVQAQNRASQLSAGTIETQPGLQQLAWSKGAQTGMSVTVSSHFRVGLHKPTEPPGP